MVPSFRDRPEYIRGHKSEVLIAAIARETGWYVIPSYDYSGEDGNKPPRLQGLTENLVIPDLDAARNGRRIWIEVKTKAHASWTRITNRYEHGIAQRHWDSYLRVQQITGCPVYLVIVEESSGNILCRSLDALMCSGPRTSRMVKGGCAREAMVFLPRDAFHIRKRTL